MKRIVFLIGLTLLTQSIHAQKYFTKTGTIHFEASVPSFEEVDARNETVTAIINTETGEIAALALVKGFRFIIALMEEHFNENYAESSKYPKTTFKGIIQEFNFKKIESTGKTYSVDGEVNFHGNTQKIHT